MRKLRTARRSLSRSSGHDAADAVARTKYSLPPYTMMQGRKLQQVLKRKAKVGKGSK